MPHINGKIEAISIKEMAKPDKYDNKYRDSMKIGEEWFSFGTTKKPEISVKIGETWTVIQKGMEVEFMYDINGDFKNIKKTTVSITDASGAVASAPVQQQAPSGTNAVNKGSFVNPAEIGQCLNLAADVLKLDGTALLNPEKVTEAISWYKEVRALFNELYEGVELKPKEQPKPKKKPTPVVEDGYDDEV